MTTNAEWPSHLWAQLDDLLPRGAKVLEVIDVWDKTGMDFDEIQRWLEAGCFSGQAAHLLATMGVAPEEASRTVSAKHGDESTVGLLVSLAEMDAASAERVVFGDRWHLARVRVPGFLSEMEAFTNHVASRKGRLEVALDERQAMRFIKTWRKAIPEVAAGRFRAVTLESQPAPASLGPAAYFDTDESKLILYSPEVSAWVEIGRDADVKFWKLPAWDWEFAF